MTVDVALRLGLQGGDTVEKSLRTIGERGSMSLKEMKAAANDLSPAMVAVSRTVGAASDKVDELAARTGAFGKVASSFGAMGTALAVGTGAVALAGLAVVDTTRKAMEFADEIDDSSTKVGVSTTALQEYRYAVKAAGGEVEDADAALQGLNKALGAAQSNLSPKAFKPFAALGFSREDLASYRSAEDILPELTKRIAALGNEAERQAVVEKLGLTPMLPLLRQGADGIANLKDEAHKLGVVMDADVVRSAADANEKFEEASKAISISFKSAVVDLAPTIATVIEKIANLTRNIVDLFTTTKREALTAQIEAIQNSERAYNDRAQRARSGAWGAFTAGATGRQAMSAAGREQFAREQEAAGARTGVSAIPLLKQLNDLDHPASPTVPKAGGTELLDPDAAKKAAEAARKAAEAARKLAQERKEAGELVAKVLGEEAVAANDLADQLVGLDKARAVGVVTSDAQLAHLKAVAKANADDKIATVELKTETAGLTTATRAYLDAARDAVGSRADAAKGIAAHAGALDDERKALYDALGASDEFAKAQELTGDELAKLRAPADAYIAKIADLSAGFRSGALDAKAFARGAADAGALLDGSTAISKAARAAPDALADPIGQAKSYKDDVASPEAVRNRELTGLNRVYLATAGRPDGISDGEYEKALAKIEERYRSLKEQVEGVTLAQQLQTAALSGQIKSWKDLGTVAVQILTDIIQRSAQAASIGKGSFGSNLVSQLGARIFGGLFGGERASFASIDAASGGSGGGPLVPLSSLGEFSQVDLPNLGRATGGPVYRGDMRPWRERGPELLSAASDGYVYDAATTAAAMRDAAPAPPPSSWRGEGSSVEVPVTLNNHSGLPLGATARRTPGGGIDIDLRAEAERIADRRVRQMTTGRRDDAALAAQFGMRRTLQGG